MKQKRLIFAQVEGFTSSHFLHFFELILWLSKNEKLYRVMAIKTSLNRVRAIINTYNNRPIIVSSVSTDGDLHWECVSFSNGVFIDFKEMLDWLTLIL